MVLNLRTSERGGREIVGVGQRDQLYRLAAHDERATKEWLQAQDAAHRAFKKTFRRRPSKS